MWTIQLIIQQFDEMLCLEIVLFMIYTLFSHTQLLLNLVFIFSFPLYNGFLDTNQLERIGLIVTANFFFCSTKQENKN
jgi:hypothetical protein